MTNLSPREIRVADQLAAIAAVLSGVPVYKDKPDVVEQLMVDYYLGDEEYVVLSADRRERPDLFGKFDGEPEWEAWLICTVELQHNNPAAYVDALNYILRRRPAYAEVFTAVMEAGLRGPGPTGPSSTPVDRT